MGIFDSIKGRKSGGSNNDGYDDNQDYDEYARDDDGYRERDSYDDGYDNSGDEASGGDPRDVSGRASGAFSNTRSYHNNTSVPLISMADVRSQELPPYDARRPTPRGVVYARSERMVVSPRDASPTYDTAPSRTTVSQRNVSLPRVAASPHDAAYQQDAAFQRGASNPRDAGNPRDVVHPRRAIDHGAYQTETMYTSPYSNDNPSPTAEVFARSSTQTLADLHATRQRISDNTGPLGVVPTNTATANAGLPIIPQPAPIQPNVNIPPYYASRSGSAMQRSAHQPSAGRAFRQLVVIRPSTYADAEQVSNAMRAGSAVVIDLTQVRAELAKRILDFSFGVAAALEAQVAPLANRVYVITSNYELTDNERELLVARGVLR